MLSNSFLKMEQIWMEACSQEQDANLQPQRAWIVLLESMRLMQTAAKYRSVRPPIYYVRRF